MNFLTPFRRDGKSDFAHGSGAELLASKIAQILGTEGTTPYSSGEMPWRTDFGAGLDRLRHQNNNDLLSELARVYVRETLERWLPAVELTDVVARNEGAALFLKIRYRTKDTTETQAEVTIPFEE